MPYCVFCNKYKSNMRYCQYCGRHACRRHLVVGVYGYGDLCIDCSKKFKKSYYGIGSIWFKRKKGAAEVNINKIRILDINPEKITKVYSIIKKYMKNKILIQSEKPNTLNYIDQGKEINIKIEKKDNKIDLKIEWKTEYGNMFSEKDFKKFDKEFEQIIKRVESKFKHKKSKILNIRKKDNSIRNKME